MKTRLELALCDLTQIISLEIWTIEDSTNMATSIIETELIADSELKRLVKQGKRESNGVKLVKKLIENNN
ncbi:hypothetical protein IJG10_02805, partial [Candidatus Saccharibacteria bacterium]|nr:hypothetical protein [Candidatus Saccharibacteria bacterium]